MDRIFQTILRINVRLSVILEFYLSSVCSASTAYTSICRGLKYLLKVKYIILNCTNVTQFLMSEKNITKINSNSLVTHIFTKLSHNMCDICDILHQSYTDYMLRQKFRKLALCKHLWLCQSNL